MRFETWYKENIIRDQRESFEAIDYQNTGTYKAMKQAYYSGMKRGLQLQTKKALDTNTKVR